MLSITLLTYENIMKKHILNRVLINAESLNVTTISSEVSVKPTRYSRKICHFFVYQHPVKCLAATVIAAAVPTTAMASGYNQTKYPIMLVHGLFGVDKIGPVDYFYGIPSALRYGGAKVFVTAVSATNSTEVRGEQWHTDIVRMLALTGATKVNLIGHSHGSPTSRYVAAKWPGLVASVTSVDGVNKGSLIADIYLKVAPTAVTSIVGNGLSTIITFLSGGKGLPQQATAAVTSLSTAGTLKFNMTYPQGVPTSACGEGAYTVNNVSYFSWSGAGGFTNIFDVTDPVVGLLSLAFFGAKNDGLVSSCSSRLGRVIRDDYRMNHLDAVNQVVGIVHLFETNPVTVYRAHANRLKGLAL
jgi:triacylglycerol lipase